MASCLSLLWCDDTGFIISVELILIATIAVIGLMVGLTAIRDATVSELSDVAGAVQDLNQSYKFYGVSGHSAEVSGSRFRDMSDFCDSTDDRIGEADNCIEFTTPPRDEFSGDHLN